MDTPTATRVFDYKVQRRIVGGIALLLAPVVTLLAERSLASISASYWTDAGGVFVAALSAVAVFLVAYNGQGKRWDLEFWLAKSAGFLAIVVALFPALGDGTPPRWTTRLASALCLETANVHYGAAVGLFVVLTAMMCIFSRRARSKGERGRGIEYAVVAGLMALGLAVGLFGWVSGVAKESGLVYWVEFWILVWFGVGWLRASWYKERPEALPAP